MKRILIILFILLLVVGCRIQSVPETTESDTHPVETTETGQTPEATIPVETPESPQPIEPVDELLDKLSLREKIGQLIIVRPDGLDSSLSRDQLEDYTLSGVTELNEGLIQELINYPVGGFVLFGKNLVNPAQLQSLMEQLKQHSVIAPFFSVDEEGGMVSRIANHPGFDVSQFPNMQDIGSTGDPNQAEQVGQTIGKYLHDLGFRLDFAPVADVNSNPNNPVIGPRAFSSDPQVVADMVDAMVKGFHESGIMTSLKHFPGHGDTATDSHLGVALTAKTWAEMDQMELIPFRAGIAAGTDMVMLGHILTPGVTGDGLPASLSPEIHRLLREELGFKGIFITDSLSMKAITDSFSTREAIVQAFVAGNDILLMPAQLREAFAGLEDAVQSGQIKETELDERVRRILLLKYNYGMIN